MHRLLTHTTFYLAIVMTAGPTAGIAQVSKEAPSRAKQLLLSRGLVPSGNVWITEREARLKRTADNLEATERRHQQAITKAEQALAANEAIRVRLAQAEAAERAKNGQSQPLPPTATAPTEGNLPVPTTPAAKLTSRSPDVTGIGEQTPLQQAMIELVNVRTAVQLAILTIYREVALVDAEYRRLKEDSAIRAAMSVVNSSARLGPARNYQRDVARAEALAAGAFKAEVPGFLESGRFRVSAILNDSQAVTLSIQAKDGPFLLSASAAQRLGLTNKDFTEPAREVEVSGRRVVARPVKLIALRIGGCIVKDVPVLVLPPEAEDLGSELSPNVLVGYQATVQPYRMVFNVTPKRAK